MVPLLIRVPLFVMVPKFSTVPLLVNVPVEVISMVPVALFVSVWPLLTVTSPFMVTVFVESLVSEPPVPIISSEPFSIVKVPVESVKEISSVTVTAPSIMMVSEPIGRVSKFQLSGSDQMSTRPPPSQILGDTVTSTVSTVLSRVPSLTIREKVKVVGDETEGEMKFGSTTVSLDNVTAGPTV